VTKTTDFDMRIVIPTRGRWDLTLTCDRLPPEWKKRVDIFCPDKEIERHKDIRPWATVHSQPDQDMTIAAKRAYIIKYHESKRIVMMDDDLQFFTKREDKPKALRSATHDDLHHYLRILEDTLSSDVPHAGFGSRLFNNNQEPGWKTAQRMQYVLGYYLPVVRDVCELGRIETREDMDYALQLLSAGYPNMVCHSFVVEQARGYGAKGGCHGQRTTESGNADARKLAELHPGYVRVVSKEYEGHPRDEVVCRWSTALRDGQERRKTGSSGEKVRQGRG
jgi:hypothetical protein